MMLEKQWQAPKKNKAQPHKTLAGTKKGKKNKDFQSMGFQNPELMLDFFLVPVRVLCI
jgi:hypothetical protein